MSWGAYAILIVFGAFIILLIFNPNMSCFGKRVKSPFYPLRRKKAMKMKVSDYKFDLGGEKGKVAKAGGTPAAGEKAPDKKTEDYGFRLD